MKAIILAAGRGSRMGSLTEELPKGLMEIGGAPLLAIQRRALILGGADRVAIVTGYRAGQTGVYGDVVFHNAQWNETSIVSSLMQAESLLEKEDCLISYSDIFYNSEVVQCLIESRGDIVIVFDKDWLRLWSARFQDPLSDAETFKCSTEGILQEIGNKTDDIKDIQGQYVGLLKITSKGWRNITNILQGVPEELVRKMDITALLKILLSNNVEIKCIPMVGIWGEVDTGEDLTLYQTWVQEGKFKILA